MTDKLAPLLVVGPALVMMLVAAVGCASARHFPRLPTGAAGTLQWRQARAEVKRLGQRYQPRANYSMNVSLALTQLQLGKHMRARGTIAVAPPAALRMVLLGPGGTTALDLWVCRDQYRFTIPALSFKRRGDEDTPAAERRGLPVSFLRWWFLQPFRGRLLSAYRRRDTDDPSLLRAHYVLRDHDATVFVERWFSPPQVASAAPLLPPAPPRPSLAVRRVAHGDEERLRVRGARCGEVRYRQRSTGLVIEVSCEQLNPVPPPARAFADPDNPQRRCGDGNG